MISYKESLKILKETNALQEGHFVLSSGLHSEKYIQCAQLLSKPNKAKAICDSLAEKITQSFKNIDLILSPALGGIIIGYELGKLLNIESIFAERVNGKFELRRGFELRKNTKVIIIEDVITTGKSSLECSCLIKKFDAKLLGYACIIDRTKNKLNLGKQIISQIKIDIPTYNKNDLPKHLINVPPIEPGSRGL